MKKFIILFFLITTILQSREIGQTQITTEEGIEVYQKEKYYLLKKNVEIESDNFNLKAQKVKAYFNKDLYDITNIYSNGNVVLTSNQGIEALGNQVDFNVKDQNIYIKGKKSYLKNKELKMKSDGSIDFNNSLGKFILKGLNSQIISTDINIKGEKIEGKYINIDGENIIVKLKVEDKTQVNIKTETLNMFALKAEYDKQNNIIQLFENVKIFRDEEIITGDYAKINTLDESYFVKTNESKKSKSIA